MQLIVSDCGGNSKRFLLNTILPKNVLFKWRKNLWKKVQKPYKDFLNRKKFRHIIRKNHKIIGECKWRAKIWFTKITFGNKKNRLGGFFFRVAPLSADHVTMRYFLIALRLKHSFQLTSLSRWIIYKIKLSNEKEFEKKKSNEFSRRDCDANHQKNKKIKLECHGLALFQTEGKEIKSLESSMGF